MASFCAKCGTALSPDNQFCPSCGTPSAAGTVAAGPAQPIAPPAKSGGSALKIILIVVAIFVGLGILAAGTVGYGIWRVAHKLGVSTNGDQVSVSAPDGKGTLSFNAEQTYSAADLGTDLYPGAQSVKGGMKMTLPTGSMVSGIFVTTDSKDQVVAFYKSRFGSDASIMDMSDAAILTLKKGEKESVMVTVSSKASENDGKTKIAIVHTTNNKPS
jgi:hypothetical protein